MADALGIFEQAVLLSLVGSKEAYGRSILKDVQIRLNRPLTAGAIYATLDRLEEKGLVSSREASGDESRAGRRRRYYVIEADGMRALRNAKEVVDRIWSGVRLPAEGTI